MRGLRSTIALVVVLIGLGAYIYFVTWKRPEGGTTAAKQEKVFASLQADKVVELKVKAESGEVTALKKDAERWQVVAPISARASESDVIAITSALTSLELTRVIEDAPTDLKQYGLDTAKVEVEFKSGDGKSSGRLLLGDKTATGGGLYARRNDEPRVFLVAAYQQSTFSKSTFDLRDKALISFQRDKLEGMDVSVDGKTLEFAKAGSEWKLTKPLEARADFSAVEGLVGRLETAQIKSVAADEVAPSDLKKYGLDKPAASVTLKVGSARATLLVGGTGGDNNTVFARDTSKSAVVTIDSSLGNDLKKGVDDYRRKDVFEFRAFNANHVELTRNGQAVAFERVKGQGDAGDKWRRVNPNAGDVDKQKMETFLASLADVRITSFVESTAKTGLDSPALVVDVKFDDGKKQERVSFGQSGSDVYVARPGDPGAGKIEAERFTEATKSLDELSK